MITKIANNNTFGAFTLIFLQGMRIFISFKNPSFVFQKYRTQKITKTDSFLTSNKLFIIRFSSLTKRYQFKVFWNFSINKVTLTNYPSFLTRAQSEFDHSYTKRTKNRSTYLIQERYDFLKSYFAKKYLTVNLENVIHFWRINRNVQWFQCNSFKNLLRKIL